MAPTPRCVHTLSIALSINLERSASANVGMITVTDAFGFVISARSLLADERDALGVPRAQLHWTWSDTEQAEWERTRSLISAEIETAGLGAVERTGSTRPDPNAHHHAGTTRMADHPDWGVVDRDGRVHGTDNLYITGASVFPTAGFANPTLTIVALAVRLAEHLRKRLAPPSSPARSPCGSSSVP